MKYIKKERDIIEAIKYDGTNLEEVKNFIGDSYYWRNGNMDNNPIDIRCKSGGFMALYNNEYVTKGKDGLYIEPNTNFIKKYKKYNETQYIEAKDKIVEAIKYDGRNLEKITELIWGKCHWHYIDKDYTDEIIICAYNATSHILEKNQFIVIDHDDIVNVDRVYIYKDYIFNKIYKEYETEFIKGNCTPKETLQFIKYNNINNKPLGEILNFVGEDNYVISANGVVNIVDDHGFHPLKVGRIYYITKNEKNKISVLSEEEFFKLYNIIRYIEK
jgi:hypothetical protein